jgi:hypothetical protein
MGGVKCKEGIPARRMVMVTASHTELLPTHYLMRLKYAFNNVPCLNIVVSRRFCFLTFLSDAVITHVLSPVVLSLLVYSQGIKSVGQRPIEEKVNGCNSDLVYRIVVFFIRK